MRARRWWWCAAALVVAGCGEAVGPVAGGRDLDFTVPVGPMVGEHTQDTLSSATMVPLGSAASSVDGSGDGILPVISDFYIRSRFDGSIFEIEYGLYGSGTGYTISVSMHVVAEDGRVLLSKNANGLSEDAGIPVFINPQGRERFNVGVSCGAHGTVNANFVIRVALPGLSKFALWSTMRQSSEDSSQPPCAPPPPPPTAGGGGGGGDELWLCWYNVWVDYRGRVVFLEEISCEKLGNEM